MRQLCELCPKGICSFAADAAIQIDSRQHLQRLLHQIAGDIFLCFRVQCPLAQILVNLSHALAELRSLSALAVALPLFFCLFDLLLNLLVPLCADFLHLARVVFVALLDSVALSLLEPVNQITDIRIMPGVILLLNNLARKLCRDVSSDTIQVFAVCYR